MGNEQSQSTTPESPFSLNFPPTVKFLKLCNLGNTCFMNSIIQALLNSRYVNDFLQNISDTTKTLDLSEEIQNSLLMELIKLKETKDTMKEQELIFSPTSFSDKLFQQMPQFVKGHQQDAHEFYISFLDSFDNTIKTINEKYHTSLSLFSNLSKGSSISETQCLMCGKMSHDFEEFETFFLSIKERTSLTHRLHIMQTPEYMFGPGKRFCSKCKINQEMKSVMTYTAIPKIVVFQFQRFEYDKTTRSLKKLKEHIPFPTELTLDKRIFQLKTVVVHIGERLSSGHFVALMRIQQKWVLASDSRFSIMDDTTVDEYFSCGTSKFKSTPSAYLLFYEEQEQN